MVLYWFDHRLKDKLSIFQELAALFGTDWAIDYLVPSIVEIRQHDSYLRRLTALRACSMMTTVVDGDAARSEMLPLLLEMATDGVSSLAGEIHCHFIVLSKELFRFQTSGLMSQKSWR